MSLTPPPISSPSTPPVELQNERSNLYKSLEAAIEDPYSVSNEWLDTIAEFKNNPRVINNGPYKDGSFHWVNKNDDVLCMAFPAILEMNGKYTKVGPYFNLGDRFTKKPTIPGLGKIKASFQLSPLTTDDVNPNDVPNEAIEQSAKAMNILQSLYAMDDNRRNEFLDPSKQPTSTPFFRTDVDSNEFKFVVNTPSIFRNLPSHDNLTVRAMSINDLKSNKSITLPRPTEMQQRGNSNLVEDVGEETNPRISILSFPDPENVYDTTLGAADVSNSYVYIPNIRNGEGDVITPDEYDTKLHDGTIVMVNVSLKLWILRPTNQGKSSFKHKDGDENGTRIYQLILNSMQTLPVTDVFQILHISMGDKRKFQDSSSKPSKKKKASSSKSNPHVKKTTRSMTNANSHTQTADANVMDVEV